ncbi:hypothetical protein ANO11243_089220 [Dothideomycetidae sp. 11243]|nr:hypothetical protein ANO11243_089220 [fungal sp. No.11243]
MPITLSSRHETDDSPGPNSPNECRLPINQLVHATSSSPLDATILDEDKDYILVGIVPSPSAGTQSPTDEDLSTNRRASTPALRALDYWPQYLWNMSSGDRQAIREDTTWMEAFQLSLEAQKTSPRRSRGPSRQGSYPTPSGYSPWDEHMDRMSPTMSMFPECDNRSTASSMSSSMHYSMALARSSSNLSLPLLGQDLAGLEEVGTAFEPSHFISGPLKLFDYDSHIESGQCRDLGQMGSLSTQRLNRNRMDSCY